MADNNQVLEFIKESFKLKEQGFYKPAIEMLYKALTIENNNIEILSELAELYYLLGNYERAINYIEKVLEVNSLHLDCLNLKQKIYLSQENYIEAYRIMLNIFSINPTQENFAKKIEILNKMKDIETIHSLEFFDIEFNEEIYYQFALAYYMQSDYEKTIYYLNKARENKKLNLKCEILLAKTYYLCNKIEEAKEIFEKYKNETDNDEIMYYMGLICLDNNKTDEAIEYLLTANKINPQNPQYCFNLSNAYFINGWIEESLKYLNIAICLSPSNIEYKYFKADIYYSISEYEKSLAELNEILKIDEKHINARVLYALNHYKLGDSVKAKVELSNIYKEYPDNIIVMKSLATVCMDLSQNDYALEIMEKVIAKEPSLYNKSDYANLLLELNFYDKAQEVIDDILNTNSNYIEGYILQAKKHIMTKDYDDAFDFAQQIISLDANNSKGYFYNALALFEQGDTNFAIESLKKAISLDVNNSSYYVQMCEFYKKLGRNEDALAYISEAASIDNNAKNREIYSQIANLVRKSKN